MVPGARPAGGSSRRRRFSSVPRALWHLPKELREQLRAGVAPIGRATRSPGARLGESDVRLRQLLPFLAERGRLGRTDELVLGDALQGVSKADAEAIQRAFGIKTIRQLDGQLREFGELLLLVRLVEVRADVCHRYSSASLTSAHPRCYCVHAVRRPDVPRTERAAARGDGNLAQAVRAFAGA